MRYQYHLESSVHRLNVKTTANALGQARWRLAHMTPDPGDSWSFDLWFEREVVDDLFAARSPVPAITAPNSACLEH